jgi:hypothetical protein
MSTFIAHKQTNTSHNWMPNSSLTPVDSSRNMGASIAKEPAEVDREVEIHNVRMFKKKKKVNRAQTGKEQDGE